MIGSIMEWWSQRLGASPLFLAAFVIGCEYLRITLQVAALRSRWVHVLGGLLTVVIQPVVLAVVLVRAIAAHPQCAFSDMLAIALLYVLWYLIGQSTLLFRPDSQGADIGFMSVGAIITFGSGAVALLVL